MHEHNHTHTHTHVKTCHLHTAAVLFWWQIRFAVVKRNQWIRVKSAESSLVTVQQPQRNLHLAIWMSSGSVADCCTTLNSSSLDNSRWLSHIKLHPIQRMLWVTARLVRPLKQKYLLSATLKLGYKCAGFSYLWQQRTSRTTLNILCKFRSNN